MSYFPLISSSVRELLHGLLIALAACYSIAPVAVAQAKPDPDIIVFKNGDQLTGTLLRGTGVSVVFKSDMAGEITVSLDNVKELRAHTNFAVIKKDVPLTTGNIELNIHPGTIDYADGTLKVENAGGISSSIPENDLAFLIDQMTFERQARNQSLLRGWRGAATAGVTDVQATNYGTTFNLGLNLVRLSPAITYLPPHDRQTFNLSETYGKFTQPVIPRNPNITDNVAKTHIFHTDLEYDRYFSPRFYALGDASFDHNYSQGLDLQQVYGGGFGWAPIQQPLQQLDLKVDVHYEKQQFQETVGTSNQNLIGSTFAETYRRTLPKKLQLLESGSILPAWNNTNAYSANGAINLALPTIHRLTVNVGLSDSFINDPPTGFLKNSFQFVTGIGYTFQ